MEIWIMLAVWLVIERVITTLQIYFMRRDVNKIKASMHPPAIGVPPPAVCMGCNRVITTYPHYCTPPIGRHEDISEDDLDARKLKPR